MKLPIIVDEHGDINVYKTAEELEQALEAIDVKNDEYIAYDANGCLLKLETSIEKKKVLGGVFGEANLERVVLNPDFCKSGYEDELIQKLNNFLRRINKSTDKTIKSLSDLVEYVTNL